MPNGHRRGGQVTRNGRTFHRRGTRIRMPMCTKALVGVGAICLGSALVGGTALIGHPVILTGCIVGVCAVIAAPAIWRTSRHRIKRGAKQTGRKVQRRIRKRWASHPNRQQVVRKAPARNQTSTDQRQPELWGADHHSSGRLLT